MNNIHKLNNKTENKIVTYNKLTTISISKENYFILKGMGNTGDSFNDVLTRILKNQPIVEKTRT